MSKSKKKDEISESPTEEQKQDRINKLRKMILKKKIDLRTDDLYLYRWLHCRDWDVDAGYKRLMKHHNFKTENPDWYPNKDFLSHEYLFKWHVKFILDGRDKHGRRVYVYRVNRMNLDEFNIQEMAKLDIIWIESIADEVETLNNGAVVLFDMKELPWRLFKWFTPHNTKLASRFGGLTPIKNLDFHLVNLNPFCNVFLSIIYPFLTQRIKENFHFHYSDWTTLHECLGREVLPEEYGGVKKLDYEKIYARLYKVNNCESEKLWFLDAKEEEASTIAKKSCLKNKNNKTEKSEKMVEISDID